MFDLPGFILGIRPDLQRLFPGDSRKQRVQFINWLLGPGASEYASVYDGDRPLHELSLKGHGVKGLLSLLQHSIWQQRVDVQKAFPLPKHYEDFIQWFYTHGLEEHRFWHLLSPDEKQLVMKHDEPWATRLRGRMHDSKPRFKRVPIAQRPFGVNVIG